MRELAVAALQTGSASLIALGLAVVATKIFAVVLGPAGIGLVSLVRQTYQSALILGALNGQTAMAQGIASREGEARTEYLSTVFWILLVGGGASALAFALLPSQISLFTMGRKDPATVQLIRWLSPAVLAGISSTYLLGILNGYREVGRIALIQVVGAAIATGLAYPVALLLRAGETLALALQMGLPGLAASALGLVFVMRGGWTPKPFRHADLRFDTGAARGFLRLAGAMLVSGFLATSIPLAVRAIVVRRFGLPGVGLLDVAWNISMNYVLLALASFSTYYIPSLSRSKELRDRQELIHQMLRLSIVLMVPLVVATAVLKPAVVRILYTPAFLPSLEIMRWMLVGDYFKVTSWVFSFTMIAYSDVKTLIWTEIAWGGLSIAGAALAILHFHSLQGVGATYMIVYLTYLAFTISYVRARRHFVLNVPIARTWLIGLGLILAASGHTWSDLEVNPALAVAYIGIATCLSWAILTPEERRGIRNGLRRTFRCCRLALLEQL